MDGGPGLRLISFLCIYLHYPNLQTFSWGDKRWKDLSLACRFTKIQLHIFFSGLRLNCLTDLWSLYSHLQFQLPASEFLCCHPSYLIFPTHIPLHFLYACNPHSLHLQSTAPLILLDSSYKKASIEKGTYKIVTYLCVIGEHRERD